MVCSSHQWLWREGKGKGEEDQPLEILKPHPRCFLCCFRCCFRCCSRPASKYSNRKPACFLFLFLFLFFNPMVSRRMLHTHTNTHQSLPIVMGWLFFSLYGFGCDFSVFIIHKHAHAPPPPPPGCMYVDFKRLVRKGKPFLLDEMR